jgi:hypothetical protein
MLLPIVALVLALPQLAGYALTRLALRAGVPEWLAAAVVVYTAIWYPTFGSIRGDLAPVMPWATLLVGLSYQLVVGAVLATAVIRHKRRTSHPAPPAPPAA